jgi:hypothetical protein
MRDGIEARTKFDVMNGPGARRIISSDVIPICFYYPDELRKLMQTSGFPSSWSGNGNGIEPASQFDEPGDETGRPCERTRQISGGLFEKADRKFAEESGKCLRGSLLVIHCGMA